MNHWEPNNKLYLKTADYRNATDNMKTRLISSNNSQIELIMYNL